MKVKINDKTMTFDDGTTLAAALEIAGIATRAVATALNGDVVPAAKRGDTVLNDGDTVLVIKAFYGG